MKPIDVEIPGIGQRGKAKVTASMLGGYDFCPHKLFLQYVERIEVPRTKAMISGTTFHEKLEVKQKAKSIDRFTFEEAIKLSLKQKAIVRAREIWTHGKKLYGKTDEILITPERKDIHLSVIDDKPDKSFVYDGPKLQVMAYCLAISENDYNFPMSGVIRGRETQNHLWEEQFSSTHKQKVAGIVENIDNILEQRATAQPKPHPAKCAKCSFNQACEHSALKKKFSLF